jgi:translation initiation factor eIF-2B subunit gamma
MSNKFLDSHVYVCRRAVLEVLEQKSRLDSFRGDFLPWLCKLQYQATRRDKYGRGSLFVTPDFSALTFPSARACSQPHLPAGRIAALHLARSQR